MSSPVEPPESPSTKVASPPELDFIDIFCFVSSAPIARIPFIFIHSSGLNVWRFVISILRLLPAFDPEAPCEIWSKYGVVHPESPVVAGPYFLKQDHVQFTGLNHQYVEVMPRIPTPIRAEPWFENTVEDSIEDFFCRILCVRDGCCLLSSAIWEVCIPTHIVPLSRPDIYYKVLSLDAMPETDSLLDISMALLLAPTLSQAFERFEWSLFCYEGRYYAHFFDPCHPLAAQYHGIHFDTSRFSSQYNEPTARRGELPDERLLLWHYQQGVQAFQDAARSIPWSDAGRGENQR